MEEAAAEAPVAEAAAPPASSSLLLSNNNDSNNGDISSYHNDNNGINTARSLGSVQHALMETLQDIEIRAQVQSTLQSMLVDVETAHSLRQELQVHSAQSQVQQLQRDKQATLNEYKAMEAQRAQTKLELADSLVKELWVLNQELVSLVEWKEKNQNKINDYDSMMAKLVQTEEELLAAEKKAVQLANSTTRTPMPQPTKSSNEESAATPTQQQQQQQQQQKQQQPSPQAADSDKKPPAGSNPVDPKETSKIETAQSNNNYELSEDEQLDKLLELEDDFQDESSKAKSLNNQSEKNNQQKEETAQAMKEEPVVSLEEEITPVPNIVEIDFEILMRIFGFLEAIDILNTAQINLQMYNRVDSLFGFSSDPMAPPAPAPPQPKRKPGQAAIKPPQPQPTNQQTTNKQPPPPPQQQQQQQQQQQRYAQRQAQQKQPQQRQPQPQPKQPPASASTTPNFSDSIFGMLQPKAVAPSQRPRTGSSASKGQTLNSAVAQSMAAKLSDNELAAIISMTEKLSKSEKELESIRSQKEELQGKLNGTEAVKQFLIGKVRDVEAKLEAYREDELKVTQQVASDQEVIAFLDSRIQELERNLTNAVIERTKFEEDWKQLQASSSQKVKVLNDMLGYERDKIRESESEWKATKKLLVREVKSCRAQILALQAERDGYREQNEMLKRAITSKSGGSPKR